MIEVGILFILLGASGVWARNRSFLADWYRWRMKRPVVGSYNFHERKLRWLNRRPNRRDYK